MKIRASCEQNRLSRRLGLLGILLSACGSITQPEVIRWQASLMPADGVVDPVMGSVAMVASSNMTQIGIGIQGALPAARLGWQVRAGSCTATGARVAPEAAFPAIQISDEGTGQAETVINRRLSGSTPYAAEVFSNAGGSGEVLGCADLARLS